jgi:putative zinc finger protein
MTCHEAREQFTALVDDALRGDERATLDAHLAECAECRSELASFQRAVGLVRAIEPARAPARFVDRVVAAARPIPWPARLARRVFTPSRRLPLQAAAIVIVAGLAVLIYRGSVEQQKTATPPSAVQPAPPVAAPPAVTTRPGSAPTPPVTTPPAVPPTPAEKAAAPPGAAPARPSVATPAPRTAPPGSSPPAKTDDANKRAQLDDKAQERKEVEARSKDKSEGERLMAKSRRDAAPAPAPSTADEKLGAERQRESDSGAASREAVGQAAQPRAQSAPLSRTGPDTGRKPGRVSDVVASLGTADVEATERQLIALAAQHGGRQTGRRVDATGVTVELDVARDRYAEFARAAAGIGTFSGPSETAVSAPTVRVDVRLDLRR